MAYDSNMSSIIIIGSGPAACAATLTLLELGWSVKILDIGDTWSKEDNALTPATSKLKLANASSFPYDLNEYLVLNGPNKDWYPSKSRGGMSTVWGATWGSSIPSTDPTWAIAEIALKKIMSGFIDFGVNPLMLPHENYCSCFDQIINTYERKEFTGNFFVLSRSTMAINKELCTLSGDCHTKCTKNAIWSSEKILEECGRYPNFEYVNKVFVRSIESQGGSIRLLTNCGNFQTKRLLLGAGPIGNSALLLKSRITEEITIQDTQIITFPLISFRKKQKHDGAFGLSGLTINAKTLSDKRYHVQLYAHPETFMTRIINSLPFFLRKFSKTPLKLLESRLFIGIMYLDSSISGEIILKQEGDIKYEIGKFERKSPYFREIRHSLLHNSLKLKIVPIWFAAKIGGVGDSYHIGSTTSLNVDSFGNLKSNPNIGILGSLTLASLEPGPITHVSMVQAIRLSQNMQNL